MQCSAVQKPVHALGLRMSAAALTRVSQTDESFTHYARIRDFVSHFVMLLSDDTNSEILAMLRCDALSRTTTFASSARPLARTRQWAAAGPPAA